MQPRWLVQYSEVWEPAWSWSVSTGTHSLTCISTPPPPPPLGSMVLLLNKNLHSKALCKIKLFHNPFKPWAPLETYGSMTADLRVICLIGPMTQLIVCFRIREIWFLCFWKRKIENIKIIYLWCFKIYMNQYILHVCYH